MAITAGQELTSPGVIRSTNEILIGLKPTITMVRQFVADLSSDLADYGAKIRVPMLSAGAVENYGDDNCGDTNTGNFEHVTGGLGEAWVTLSNTPKITIPITQKDKLEVANDSFWGRCAEAGVDAIGKAISKAVCDNFTKANIEPDGTTRKVVMASVTKNAIAKLRTKAASKGRVSDYVLMLDGEYFADLISLLDSNVFGGTDPIQDGVVPNLYGFKAIICSYDLPEGIKGVLVPANGLAIAVRPLSIPDPSAYPEYGVQADENGFAVTAMRHTSFATGKCFYNVATNVGTELLRKEDTFYIQAS